MKQIFNYKTGGIYGTGDNLKEIKKSPAESFSQKSVQPEIHSLEAITRAISRELSPIYNQAYAYLPESKHFLYDTVLSGNLKGFEAIYKS